MLWSLEYLISCLIDRWRGAVFMCPVTGMLAIHEHAPAEDQPSTTEERRRRWKWVWNSTTTFLRIKLLVRTGVHEDARVFTGQKYPVDILWLMKFDDYIPVFSLRLTGEFLSYDCFYSVSVIRWWCMFVDVVRAFGGMLLPAGVSYYICTHSFTSNYWNVNHVHIPK